MTWGPEAADFSFLAILGIIHSCWRHKT